MDINSTEWRKLLQRLAVSADIHLEDETFGLLGKFAAELLAWNEKTNLTAITEPAEVAEKHILDSLIPGSFIQSLLPVEELSLLDIGSGGGFPGIPLKIFMPHLRVTMVDSVRKKVNFLKYVIRTLQLDGIDAIHARIEDLTRQKDFAGHFDVVISRAFTALDRFLILGAPFLKPGGVIIAMKGKEVRKELDAMEAKAAGPSIYKIGDFQLTLHLENYTLPESGGQRSLVIGRKGDGS
ncbi:MAG: 16S rRNA (guanine(527)-N(7))-methyltransferase RsmG [Desulfosalsimonadaceae bacterium]|nr:16S rRNA (guanine(527)-N(7))-methyltransferase RsmG [Desulfosalsimonadaceae bacterium]